LIGVLTPTLAIFQLYRGIILNWNMLVIT